MDGIILAGGIKSKGRKLPGLLKIGDETVIEKILKSFDFCGINNVFVLTNDAYYQQLKDFVDDTTKNHKFNIKIISIPDQPKDGKIGSIYALYNTILTQKIKDDVVIVGQDNYFDFDLSKICSYFNATKKPIVCLYDIKSKSKAKNYGCVNLDSDGYISSFYETPITPTTTLVSTSIYFLPKESLFLIGKYLKSGANKSHMGNLIKKIATKRKVRGIVCDGTWINVSKTKKF